jgi:acyl-CoA hydrolase
MSLDAAGYDARAMTTSDSPTDTLLQANTSTTNTLSQPRPQSHSVTDMTEYVLPQHANAYGSVFGGQIMAWVDLCAAICAQRHSGRACVTAFVDDLKFEKPVRVGEVVRLRAKVSAVFRTSLEIDVDVQGEDATTGRTWPCVHARVTFVALDATRAPTPIPRLALDSEATANSQREGEERRARRLSST